MDAVNDPTVQEIVLIKSAQTGGTAALLNILGYFIDQDPSPIMWVTTTLGEAEAFSRDRFEPFRRDNPRVAAKIGDPRQRDSGNTILDKRFAGGRLLFRGANSAPSLRSHPIRVVIMDEVDGYPPTTSEGEPTKLAQKRATAFWNRKIVKCSTPGDKATSRIAAAYERSDRRLFHVPCPKCGEVQPLVWGGPSTPHGVKWEHGPDGEPRPETARYLCRREDCGHLWTDVERWDAVRKGRWVGERPCKGIAGFKLNELVSPFKRLEETVAEFLDAKGEPAKLKEWLQQAMAEPWEQRGEAPDWHLLALRQEPLHLGTVPARACLLTAGVDVQDNRLEVGLYAWNRRKESWLVHYEVIAGDTREPEPWIRLDEMLAAEWPHEHGMTLPIRVMCVDRGGHRAPKVDAFAGRHPQPAYGPAGVVARRARTVVACVGRDDWKARVLGASDMDKAKRRRQALIVTLGSSYLKSEIQTWLRQPWPSPEEAAAGVAHPIGAHHVPEDIGEAYLRQLCSEHVVTVRERGVTRQRFVVEGRNEALDVFALARAGAHMVGLDHFVDRDWLAWEEMVAAPEPSLQPPAATAPPAAGGQARGAWSGRPGGFLGRR